MALDQSRDFNSRSSRINELIEQLNRSQEALQESMGGEIDSVVDASGRPLLLQQAQEALQESEALHREASKRLRAIFDSLPANIVLLDKDGLITSFNEYWRRFALENGWSQPDEAIGWDYLAISRRAQGEDRVVANRIADGIAGVLQGTLQEYHDEYACSSPSRFRWFQVMVSPFELGGTSGGALVMHIDITERKQAEQSRERLQHIIENTTDVVGITVPEGHISYLNQAGRQLIGLGKTENSLQYHFSEFCPNWTYELLEHEVLPTIMQQGLWEGEVAMLTRTGEERILSMVCFPQRAASGELESICSISRDITEQKRSQEESRLLARLALSIENEHDLHSSLETVLREVIKMTGWTFGEAWLPCEHETYLQCSPAWYSSEPGMESFRRTSESLTFHKDEGFPGVVWSRGECIWNENIIQDPCFHRAPVAATAELKSAVGFPVLVGKETVAILVFFLKEAHSKDQRLTNLVSTVTTQMGGLVKRKQAHDALRESEQKFRQLAENIQEVFWIFETRTRTLLYVSPAFESIWGRSRQSLYDAPFSWISAIHPEDQERVRASAPAGNPVHYYEEEYRIIRPDGSIRWIKDRAFPVFNEAGEIWRMTGIAEDITERKLAEEERKKVIKDLNERVKELRAIHYTARLLEDETISIDNLLERMHDILKPAWQYPESTAVRILVGHHEKASPQFSKTSWSQSAAIVTQQGILGEIRVAYTDPKPVADEGPFLREERAMLDSIADMLGVFFDRRHANEQMERLAAFPRENPNPTFELNSDGRVAYFNKSAAELTRELNKDLVDDVLPPDTGSIVTECLRSGSSRRQIEARLNDRTLSWSFFPIPNTQMVHCYGTDVTEQKQLQEQFYRSQRMESLGTLASGVAHDMNNILSPINLAAQLLRNKITGTKERQWLDRITASVDRGAQIMKQLVTFGRGLEGEQEPLDVRELFKGLKNITLSTFPKSIEIETDIPRSVWRVNGDVTQLHQVLLNLCVNARDAMADGGTLSIKAENRAIQETHDRQCSDFVPGKYVVIEITDSGNGIPPDIINRVTEPFFTTKSAQGGSGLGLSTAAGIVRGHNGYLEIESTLGTGSTFRVLLPALPEEAPSPCLSTEKSLPKGDGKRILIVDDEAEIREMTSAILECYGYQPITAQDGAEALSLISQSKEEIRLVLTDLFMPTLDGAALAQTIKQCSSPIELVVMTGYIDQSRVEQLKEIGVENILEKPFSQNALIEMINKVLA